MPNAGLLDAPEHDEILAECDVWLSAADAPISIQKDADSGQALTYAFTRQDGVTVELPIIGGFGSSTLIDSDKDVFHKQALISIVESAKPRMTTWRNHKFTVPDDNVGFLADYFDAKGGYTKRGLWAEAEARDPQLLAAIAATYGEGQTIKVDADHGLLGIASTVNTAIDKAVVTYEAIMNGSEYGWSIGCKYGNAQRRTDGRRGAIQGFDVWKVITKEMSVVSLPANPLAWVDCARKSLIQRGVIPPGPMDPEYAYVMKHWDEFDKRIKGEMEGDDLEKAAISVKLRRVGEYAEEHFGLVWAFNPNNRRLW